MARACRERGLEELENALLTGTGPVLWREVPAKPVSTTQDSAKDRFS
jgi:hypothetical protein